MQVSKGLYEVITSKKMSLETKLETIPRFSWPIKHLDGEHAGWTEPGEITEEDASLICEALKQGNVKMIKRRKQG